MRRSTLFWSVVLLAMAAAFAHAWILRWTCDDAFISFRYAEHLAAGHGLVFNLDPGEAPVEGYTNFAWTMWLALGVVLGCGGDALETWAAVSGALLHGGTTLLLGLLAWRASGGRALVPIAAVAWAAHYYAASLAPAGLETALFVGLAVAMYGLTVAGRCRRQQLLLGFCGVLTVMTRPDGAIFVAMAGAVLLVDALRRRSSGGVVAFAVPLLGCLVPYLLWRHAYYGYWVPNTFYAKSGADPYPSQGWDYVSAYARTYAVALLPAALALLALPWRRCRDAAASAWTGPRPGVVLLAFVVPYLVFVFWVGGDFMFARFLLPITPLLLFAVDLLLARRPALGVGAAVVLGCGAWFRHEPAWVGDYTNPHGFSDNRAISFLELAPGLPLTEYARRAGHEMARLFDGLDVRLGIAGGHANFACRARVPVAIECAAGLTDAYIAHLPIPGRSQPGHERNWHLYPGYLERRGVHFMLELSYATGSSVDAARAIAFPVPGLPPALAMPARLVIWDRQLMRTLRERQPELQCGDFERALDDYLAALPGKAKDEVARDFAGFRQFYFDHNDDPQRRAAFERFLAGR